MLEIYSDEEPKQVEPFSRSPPFNSRQNGMETDF